MHFIFLLLIITLTCAQNITYNINNDGRCNLTGENGCNLMAPEMWVNNTAPGYNSTVLISTSSPIFIYVNSTTPYFRTLYLNGNVTVIISETGNLSAATYFVGDKSQVNIQNGTINGGEAHFYDDSVFLGEGGKIILFWGCDGMSTQPAIFHDTFFRGFAFFSAILYCKNCNFTTVILGSSVLNFTGQLTGGIQDMNLTELPTNLFIDTASVDSITLSSGTATIKNAQVTGTLNIQSTANITFDNCGITVSTVYSAHTSYIILVSSSLVVTGYISAPIIVAGPQCSLSFCSGYLAGLIQTDVDNVNANLPINIASSPYNPLFIDGTATPVFLRSNVTIPLQTATLALIGNITIYPVRSAYDNSSSLSIMGNGGLIIGYSYGGFRPDPLTLVHFSSPFFSNVSVVMNNATLEVPEITVASLLISQGDSVIYGNINLSYFEIESRLTVAGNVVVSTSYTNHIHSGYVLVTGSLNLTGELKMVEDSEDTLYALNPVGGSVSVANAKQIIDTSSVVLVLYNENMYSIEGFSYNLIVSEEEGIVLQYAFTGINLPHPRPWYLQFWFIYGAAAAIALIVVVSVRQWWSSSRRGYHNIA